MRQNLGVRYELDLQHLQEDDVSCICQLFGHETKWDGFVAGENRRIWESSIHRHPRRFRGFSERIIAFCENTLLPALCGLGELMLPSSIGFLVGIPRARRLNGEKI